MHIWGPILYSYGNFIRFTRRFTCRELVKVCVRLFALVGSRSLNFATDRRRASSVTALVRYLPELAYFRPVLGSVLGQREPQQLQTQGAGGMSRCQGRGDCKSCLAKSGGCSWCTYTDSTGAAAATCLFEDTANLCEDIRTVCPVAVESESSVAPIETVVGGAVGVAVGSCGLVFLFLYIMVRTFQQRPRMALVLTHTHTHTHTHRVRRYTARSTVAAAAAPGTATLLWLGEATRLHGGWRPSPREKRSTVSCRAKAVLQGHCC